MHLHPWEASPCRESRASPPTACTAPPGRRCPHRRQDHYLGPHGSEESKQKYERIVRKLIADRTKDDMRARVEIASDLTINELGVRYLHFVDGYYPSNEPANIRHALRPLRKLYGFEMVTSLGPLKLKAVRRESIAAGHYRSEINKRVSRIIRMLKWGVGEELVPASVHHALKAVEGLKKGRGDVRESSPVKPVPAEIKSIRSARSPRPVRGGPERDRHQPPDRQSPGAGSIGSTTGLVAPL
jgi:hypothetical protein